MFNDLQKQLNLSFLSSLQIHLQKFVWHHWCAAPAQTSSMWASDFSLTNNFYHLASSYSPFLEHPASDAHELFQAHFCGVAVSTEAAYAILPLQTFGPLHPLWPSPHWFDLWFLMLVAVGPCISCLSYFFGLLIDATHSHLRFCHRGCLRYHFQAMQNCRDSVLGYWLCSRLWRCLGRRCDMLQLWGPGEHSFWYFE